MFMDENGQRKIHSQGKIHGQWPKRTSKGEKLPRVVDGKSKPQQIVLYKSKQKVAVFGTKAYE